MELIKDFWMPPFARVIWVSPEARAQWGPRIREASTAFHRLEELSVVHGLRRVFTAHFRPEDLPQGVRRLAKLGLSYLPLQRVGSYSGFAHYHPPVEPGKPWTYYGVAGRPEDLALFADATERGDHDVLGELLGYPACCRRFFSEVWLKGYIDPVWQAAEAAANEGAEVLERGARLIHLKAAPEALPTLRYIGIRLVPHIPHSLTCPHSRDMARQWLELAKSEGLGDALAIAREVLSWPMEWSVLHGIVEVRTPLFTVSTNSMPTAGKWTVRIEGETWPEGAPPGLYYPHHTAGTGKRITSHPAFVRAEDVIPLP